MHKVKWYVVRPLEEEEKECLELRVRRKEVSPCLWRCREERYSQLGSRCVSTGPLQPHLLASSSDFKATLVKSVPQPGLWIPKHSQIPELPDPNLVTPPTEHPCPPRHVFPSSTLCPSPVASALYIRPLPLCLPWCHPNLLAVHQASAHWPTVSPVSTSFAKRFLFFILWTCQFWPLRDSQSPSGSCNTGKHLSHHMWLHSYTFAHWFLLWHRKPLQLRCPITPVLLVSAALSKEPKAHRKTLSEGLLPGEDGWKERGIIVTVVLTWIVVTFMYRFGKILQLTLPTPWGRWSSQGNWAHKARKWWNYYY